MEENRKKRDWVKNAAIVFLTVMLLLTFFSNTIMNHSLPEVATEYITSGTIVSKIRGTGVVESGDPYNVQVMEARKVAGIVAQVGDEVEKDDILLYLEDEESEELKAALDKLEALQDEYDAMVVSGLDISLVNRVEGGNAPSIEEYKQRVDTAKKEMDDALLKVDQLEDYLADTEDWIDALNLQISLEEAKSFHADVEESALNVAKSNLDNAKIAKQQAQNNYDALMADPNATPEAKNQAQQQLVAASTAVTDCEAEVNRCQQAYNDAVINAETQKSEVAATIQNLKNQVAHNQVRVRDIGNDLAEHQEDYERKQKVYNDLVNTSIPAEMNLVKKLEDIAEQKEEVAKLRDKSEGATITAPVAGKIISVNVVSGETTNPAMPVFVIQPEGKGYTVSISVTKEQATRVSVGDPADLVNAWWGSEMEAVVQSIRPDPNNPSKNKLIIFKITGEVTAGQSLTLSVGQKSAEYSTIVPNSAIREDNNGKFILIVEQKSSPLGNRFVATRVDVEVLASDDTKTAIQGGVYGYENVITTATQPIEAGQLIRLPD
ncbi:MAG: HlyD family efflux transporter periplasmic adaptor subunit [Lachnospiraceae bacterium]|nr:HlyD family efflux transporter periplasmic adaptor subunit [Lachnospiraceae bacterium]